MNKEYPTAMATNNSKVMSEDRRYRSIKILMEARQIKSFREIFVFIPKTKVYRDLRMNFTRFDKSIGNPALFRINELMQLARLFGVDPKKIIDMAYQQVMEIDRSKKKSQ